MFPRCFSSDIPSIERDAACHACQPTFRVAASHRFSFPAMPLLVRFHLRARLDLLQAQSDSVVRMSLSCSGCLDAIVQDGDGSPCLRRKAQKLSKCRRRRRVQRSQECCIFHKHAGRWLECAYDASSDYLSSSATKLCSDARFMTASCKVELGVVFFFLRLARHVCTQ